MIKSKDVDKSGTHLLTNRSSCHPIDPDPFGNGSKEAVHCEINVLDEDVGYRVVAKGTLLWSEPGEIIHNVPLRDDHVKVCFKQVLKGEESTPLPVPFFGHEVLGDDVVGSWAQWPRKEVKVLQELTVHNQRGKKENSEVAKKGMDHGSVAGDHCKGNDDDDGIPPFLLSKVKKKRINDSIDYFCPQKLGLFKHRPVVLSSYLAHSISKQSTKQYILTPFYQEAYRTLNLSHGARKSLSWNVVDCPQQPGGVECGYYVMMYMHKIVSLISQNESNLQKDFTSSSYSQAEVDAMREVWCRYFIDQCV